MEDAREPAPLPGLDGEGEVFHSPIVQARVDRLARQLMTLHDAVARMAPGRSGTVLAADAGS